MRRRMTALLRDLLLTGDRAARTLLRARVRVRALAANRQPATMANATVGADVHQSLDVHRHLGAQRAFHLVITLDHAADLVHIGISEIANAKIGIDASLLHDLLRRMTANAVDVRQSDLDLFVAREIDASNTSHS